MLTRVGRSTFTAALAFVCVAACGGSAESDVPTPTQKPPMEGQRLSLYTHCGVLSAVVDGQLWLADPPPNASAVKRLTVRPPC